MKSSCGPRSGQTDAGRYTGWKDKSRTLPCHPIPFVARLGLLYEKGYGRANKDMIVQSESRQQHYHRT